MNPAPTAPAVVPAKRAKPLGRAERRAAIVAATVPLLEAHGASVTTRQIAEAAGVAEGTLFRAFADKDELLHAAVLAALDPNPALQHFAEMPPAGRLTEEITHIAEFLTERQTAMMRVFMAAHRVLGVPGTLRGENMGAADKASATSASAHHGDLRLQAPRAIVTAVAERLEPHRGCLRVSTRRAARTLYSLIIANSLPMTAFDGRLELDDIVDVTLHGIASSDAHARAG